MIKISRPEILWPSLAVVAVAAVGAWLRFRNLAVESLWFDEAVSWYQSKDSVADLISRTADDNYPPLHNLLLYSSMKLFGDGEWPLRLPSAILGTANILLVYWLGSLTIGRAAGLLAAAFLAFSVYHIYYSQEARMYALLAFTATLFAASSFYFFLSPSIARAVLVCLSGLSLLYTHPFGALNWIGLVMAFGACLILGKNTTRQTLKIWTASNALAAACFAPWAWLILERAADIQERGFWIPYPTAEYVLVQLLLVTSGPSLATLLAVGTMFAVLPARDVTGLERPKTTCSPIPVFILWAVLPVGIALLTSVVSTPIFRHRYLIGALPPLCLAAAYGFTRFAREWVGLAIVFAVCLAILVPSSVNHKRAQKQDWRGVAALLEQRLDPSDCVVIFRGYQVRGLSYYYRKKLGCRILSNKLKTLDVGGIESRRVFAIVAGGFASQKKKLAASFASEGWSLEKTFSFRKINVSLYVRPDQTGSP